MFSLLAHGFDSPHRYQFYRMKEYPFVFYNASFNQHLLFNGLLRHTHPLHTTFCICLTTTLHSMPTLDDSNGLAFLGFLF